MIMLVGGILWGLAMVASMLVYQWQHFGLNTFHLASLCRFYFAGGFLGWTVSLPIARWIGRRRSRETRLAACMLGLTLGTLGFTALVFAIEYRSFYARWHDPVFTVTWGIQLIATTLGACYQFLVLGLPQYLPIAFPLLLVVSFALAKWIR